MTIAAAGLLTGYDGDFPFDKPGDQYGDINYTGMRMVQYCVIS
jgi:dolichyl-phosphate-mannose-protein mannosyltransferase